MFSEMRLFKKMATSVLVVFIGIMVVVTITAYSRRSGSTRQDMAQAQLMRKAALPQPIADESP
jgi:hypothetical protein